VEWCKPIIFFPSADKDLKKYYFYGSIFIFTIKINNKNYMITDAYPHQNHAEPAVTDQLPPAFGAHEAQPKDHVLIPTYDPSNQFGISDLERVFPEWREQTSYDDPGLAAISYTRTQALRENGRRIGVGDEMTRDGGEGLLWAIQHTPREVGQSFQGHGIENSRKDPIASLDYLLTEGIDPNKPALYTAPFVDNSEKSAGFADHPFTGGGLIVMSKTPEGGRPAIEDKSDITSVVVGEEYMQALDLMRNRYPGVTFVPWNEAPEFLTRQANEAGITNVPLEDLQTNEPIYYEERAESFLPGPATLAGSVAVAEHIEPAAPVNPSAQPPDTRTEEQIWEDSVW
jgi:hypothetical protein